MYPYSDLEEVNVLEHHSIQHRPKYCILQLYQKHVYDPTKYCITNCSKNNNNDSQIKQWYFLSAQQIFVNLSFRFLSALNSILCYSELEKMTSDYRKGFKPEKQIYYYIR